MNDSYPKYPKIDSLFNRDPKTHKVIIEQIRNPEFTIISSWDVYEKIDGTNIRVHWEAGYDEVLFGGRTNQAQINADLVTYLNRIFMPEKFCSVFLPDGQEELSITLFGEGYGPKIQKGGKYRNDVSFRLFDIKFGSLWLTQESIKDIAKKLNIKTVPFIGNFSHSTANSTFNYPYGLINLVKSGFLSQVAIEDDGYEGCLAEGVVARSNPLLLDRMGRRVMWKLKTKDF